MAKFYLNDNLNMIYKNMLNNNTFNNRNIFNSNMINRNIPNRNPSDRKPSLNNSQVFSEHGGSKNDQTSASSYAAPASSEPQNDRRSYIQKRDSHISEAMDNECDFLDFNKESILKGIILSEILGKPRAKRGFRR